MTPKKALLSKREQMIQLLLQGLAKGLWPAGGRLPAEGELSTRYGISKNTVREAVSALVEQGRLSRQQGRGTFVLAPPAEAPVAAASVCALFVQTRGHVYDPQTKVLVRELQRRGYSPMLFDLQDLAPNDDPAAASAALARAQAAGLHAIITEGDPAWILAAARAGGWPCPPVYVINQCDPPPAPGCHYVLSDFVAGPRLATEHLLQLGHEEILLVIHRDRWSAPGVMPGFGQGRYHELVRGYREAMGPSHRARLFFLDHELQDPAERQALRELLTGPAPPSAVLAIGDKRALEVAAVAREAGLHLPHHLALVGYYNTPWVAHLPIPLSSVSIREEVIARLAVRWLAGELPASQIEGQRLIVPPELQVRASCGGCASTSISAAPLPLEEEHP